MSAIEWAWLTVSDLCGSSPKNGIYKPASRDGSGTPIIRIDDLYDGRLVRLKGFKRVSLSPEEAKDFGLSDGDIIINRVNSMDYLGKSALIQGIDDSTVFEGNIMKIEPV